ncbi:MAG: sugar transferase [Hyphomicrobiaceae bacterium]|nr:sugar transferase [Hyphomicrobiaceae bacterium]
MLSSDDFRPSAAAGSHSGIGSVLDRIDSNARPDGRSRRLTGVQAKRAFDVLVASIVLVLLLPLLLSVALLIRVTMGRPVLFAHTRLGKNGRQFSCLKFRSMANNSAELLARHLERSPGAAREWQLRQKLSCDPRVTRLGHALRKSSIDELPQLINVLRGEMSCVGPRPIVASEVTHYGPHAEDYFRVRPGITGLWQVSGRSSVSYPERVALDSQYVRNWSFWLDIKILLKTIPVIARPDQAS